MVILFWVAKLYKKSEMCVYFLKKLNFSLLISLENVPFV